MIKTTPDGKKVKTKVILTDKEKKELYQPSEFTKISELASINPDVEGVEDSNEV